MYIVNGIIPTNLTINTNVLFLIGLRCFTKLYVMDNGKQQIFCDNKEQQILSDGIVSGCPLYTGRNREGVDRVAAPLSPQWRQVSAAFSVAVAAREVTHVVHCVFFRSLLFYLFLSLSSFTVPRCSPPACRRLMCTL